MMRALKEMCRHLAVILSLMFLVFLVLDQFNPLMKFVDNPISQALLAVLCLCAAALGLSGRRIPDSPTDTRD